jgi:hypothetical protein
MFEAWLGCIARGWGLLGLENVFVVNLKSSRYSALFLSWKVVVLVRLYVSFSLLEQNFNGCIHGGHITHRGVV